jgi:hypothetical protein
MRLTSTYTRVAVPKYEFCPWCGTEIADWFLEWYPKEGQYEDIRDGKLAMDCPVRGCRKPVLMNKGKIVPAPQGTEPAIRPIEGAERWLKVTNSMWPDLKDFLVDPDEQPRTKYFRSGYWPEINV